MNNKGFSLVELMVVVAIIGILAAVAVPQFSKFQAKSRQSEAKSSLTAIYTAEKSFNAEYAGYSSAFRAMGYSPTGDVQYNVGFSAACASWTGAAGCAPQYDPDATGGAVAVGDAFTATGYCGAAGAAMPVEGCRMKETGAVGAAGTVGPIALAAAALVTRTTFTAEAASVVYQVSTTTADRWRINENKVMTQTSNGIQ